MKKGKYPVQKRVVSDAALCAAKPVKKAYKIAAGDSLYLEVMPGGSKLWRWEYRLLGKENGYALGSYPELSVKQARDATEAACRLVKQGIYPSHQKQLDWLKGWTRTGKHLRGTC